MAIPYSIINQIMGSLGRSVIDPITTVDSMIPFIGWTFLIYVSLYLYYPAVAWFGRDSEERIREMFAFYQSLFTMTWVVFAVFIIFPTEIYIREDIPQSVLVGEGFWGFWYGDLMHKTDLPYNAWPSLSCYAIFADCDVDEVLENRRRLKEAALWVVGVALCIGNDHKATLLFRLGYRNHNRHNLLVLHVHPCDGRFI